MKMYVSVLHLLSLSLISGSPYLRCENMTPEHEDNQVRHHISNSSVWCPPRDYYSSSCQHVPNDALISHGEEFVKTSFILDCYCATYDNNKELVEVGQCPYNCARYRENKLVDVIYQPMPPNMSEWNSYMCGSFSRSGSLCGECNEDNNVYLRTYSFDLDCIRCEHGAAQWWKYMISAYLPLSFFCLIIYIFKVDIHSSPIRGFILFSQFLSLPAQLRITLLVFRNKEKLLQVVKLLGALFGIWNLDFFRVYHYNICLGLGSLANLFLDLAVAAYPTVLIAFIYMLIRLYDRNYKILIYSWKPFNFILGRFYKKLAIKTSILDVITTFLFLANMKVLSVCFDALTPVKVYQLHRSGCTSSSLRLFYDPTIHYFSSEHRLYAVSAIIIIFFMYFCPLLIVTVHSCKFFHIILSHLFPHRFQLFYNTFMDSFYGSYRDGTEPGSKDCRWYAIMLPITRGLLMSV